MDGSLAPLPDICDLADKYDAVVMVDDSHATGILGPGGRGTAEAARRAWIASTSSPARSARRSAARPAASPAAGQEIVDYLRQRSRPYLFSNAAAAADRSWRRIKALELISDEQRPARPAARQRPPAARGPGRSRLHDQAGQHPILPVMLGDAALATQMADKLLEKGIYVIGFSFPVVPQGQARIRIQLSAAHTPEQLERAIAGVHGGRQGAANSLATCRDFFRQASSLFAWRFRASHRAKPPSDLQSRWSSFAVAIQPRYSSLTLAPPPHSGATLPRFHSFQAS